MAQALGPYSGFLAPCLGVKMAAQQPQGGMDPKTIALVSKGLAMLSELFLPGGAHRVNQETIQNAGKLTQAAIMQELLGEKPKEQKQGEVEKRNVPPVQATPAAQPQSQGYPIRYFANPYADGTMPLPMPQQAPQRVKWIDFLKNEEDL